MRNSTEEKKVDITWILPEECVSHIISFTSPRDACRLAVVSPGFKSAADSDAVWERLLPSDYREVISNSVSASSLTTSLLKKKDLYFYLCQNPILINNGTMSFSLERESGKKCYMIRARAFATEWGNTPRYWAWPSLPESRFAEVAKLKLVWWFDIKGGVETKIFSSKTNYVAYFVFKFAERRYGFESRPVKFEVYLEGSENWESRSMVLDPPANMLGLSQNRGDGWMEIEMGEFFNENGDDGKVLFSVFDFDGWCPKHGIIVQGIELRPKV